MYKPTRKKLWQPIRGNLRVSAILEIDPAMQSIGVVINLIQKKLFIEIRLLVPIIGIGIAWSSDEEEREWSRK